MVQCTYDLIAANQWERCCRGEGPSEGGKPVQAERQARERRRRLRLRRPQDARTQRIVEGRLILDYFNLLQFIKNREILKYFSPLQDFADKLGVDAFDINSVVSDLREDANVHVEPKPQTDVQVSSVEHLPD